MITKRLLYMLLMVSLAFNLAVAGSLVWFKALHPKHPPRERIYQRDFPKMPEHIMREEWSSEIIQYRKDFDNSKLRLMEELQKETLDETIIESIIDSSLVAQNNLERYLGKRLVNYREQMTAEEADEYFGKRIEHIKNRNNYFRQSRRNPHEKDNRNHPDARPAFRDSTRTKSRRRYPNG